MNFLEHDYLNIVMEYCGDTDLKQFIKNHKSKYEFNRRRRINQRLYNSNL